MRTNHKNCTHPSSTDERMVAELIFQLSHQPIDESPPLSMNDKQLKSVIYLKEVSDRMTDKLRTQISIDSDDVFF